MKIAQVLYLAALVKDMGSENKKTLCDMLARGGLFDQDFSTYLDKRLDDVYDLLNDMRCEGVEDARYWQEQIMRYQEKNRAKLLKIRT